MNAHKYNQELFINNFLEKYKEDHDWEYSGSVRMKCTKCGLVYIHPKFFCLSDIFLLSLRTLEECEFDTCSNIQNKNVVKDILE